MFKYMPEKRILKSSSEKIKIQSDQELIEVLERLNAEFFCVEAQVSKEYTANVTTRFRIYSLTVLKENLNILHKD